jgi:hypothetical protein
VIPSNNGSPPSPSGTAVDPRAFTSAPFVLRVRLDDASLAQRLPSGSVGAAAVYTDHIIASHIIRQVILRQTAFLNYIVPF